MWLQKSKQTSWLIGLLIGVSIVFQSCMKNDEDIYDFNTILVQDVETIQTYLDTNGIDAEIDSETGVFHNIEEEGSGYKTVINAELEVHIEGHTLEGVEFTNTFDGSPITVILGQAENPPGVTSGLLLGLIGLHEGDSVTIYSPSPWGYQNQGYQNVPPNSILVYTAKLIKIRTLEEDYADIDEYISKRNWVASVEPEYGIRYVVHKPGDQNKDADYGDDISVDYQGELLDSTVFDSSAGKQPLSFSIGSGSLIVGFEAGVSQLYELDSATLLIPSVYAYGKSGSGAIPPDTPILFGVDVVSVTKSSQ